MDPPVTQVWVNRCIPYFINRNNSLFDGEQRRTLIRESFDVWENVAGSDLRFIDIGYTDETLGFDPSTSANRNALIAVESENEAAAIFSSPRQVAITVTSFSVETGEIFDADIAVNAVSFTFDDVTSVASCTSMPTPPYDLHSILAHEIGHIVGFDHPPDTESTMYAAADQCEIKKRTLTADDTQGLVDVYPSGQSVSTCDPPQTAYDALEGVDRFRDQCDRRLDGDGSSCSCRSARWTRSAGRADSDPSDVPTVTVLGLAVLLALRFRPRPGMFRRV